MSDEYPKNFMENHLADKVKGMSDLYARVDQLEKRLKIIEVTLQWFFEPQFSTPEPDEPINRNYP